MTKTIKPAKTLNTAAARKAVNVMVNEMNGMFDWFCCPGKMVKTRFNDYSVEIYIDGQRESATLYRNGDEFICIADIYCGEKTTFSGSNDGTYTFNDNMELIAA